MSKHKVVLILQRVGVVTKVCYDDTKNLAVNC